MGLTPTLVDDTGTLPLPWLAVPLAAALSTHRGHALLVHAAPGTGAMAFAFTLAQAWLCEAEDASTGRPLGRCSPCGRCGSCKLFQSHLHPDLTVLMPETLRREQDWPLPDDKTDGDDSKRKPSRQIRIDEVRLLIERTTRTSARGRGKVALLHPADALNLQSANALLKTLEEPPAGTRLLLTTSDPAGLLPTVRSRCQHLRLPDPPVDVALPWLATQGLKSATDAQVLLAACSGRPLDALTLLQAGVDAVAWAALPAAVANGQAGALAGWPIPRALDAMQKLCHDALALALTGGGSSRYFPPSAVAADAQPAALVAWSAELQRVARHSEHPWSKALLLESLVRAGSLALAPAARSSSAARGIARGRTRGTAPRGLDTLGA